MITEGEVKKLAELARLELTKDEVAKLQGEITSILEYIDTIQKIPLLDEVVPSTYLDLKNVMREDENPHEGGLYSDEIINQFPNKDGDFLKVKKILP